MYRRTHRFNIKPFGGNKTFSTHIYDRFNNRKQGKTKKNEMPNNIKGTLNIPYISVCTQNVYEKREKKDKYENIYTQNTTFFSSHHSGILYNIRGMLE